MTWVDLAVLAVLGLSGLLSLSRGFAREVLGIGAWAGASAAAVEGMPLARDFLSKWITDPAWIDPAGFALVFLITLIVLSVAAGLLGRLIRGSALGGIDRTLGLLFGLLRGAAVVIFAYILGSMLVPIDHWPEPARQARFLMPTYKGAAWAVSQLPEEWRPKLPPPPPEREPTSEALLHATPQGTATGRANAKPSQ